MNTPDEGQAVLGRRRRGFQPGHPKVGGRKPGGPRRLPTFSDAPKVLARLEARLKRTVDPLEALLTIALAPLEYLEGLGWTHGPVSLDVRIDCLKAALPYTRPKAAMPADPLGLPAGEGPSGFDVTALLKDPKLAAAAQQIALALVVKTRDPEP